MQKNSSNLNPSGSFPAQPPKRVLLVDDEHTAIKLYEKILTPLGCNITVASDGQDAWLKMTPENMPQLIISDIVMPKMDGFAFLKQLKLNSETTDIPILVVSTQGHMEYAIILAGADAFLDKPFSNEKFLSTVKKLLK